MKRLALSGVVDVEYVLSGSFVAGELQHVQRNAFGGGNRTCIGQFFVWRNDFSKSMNTHWQVDVFLLDHMLSPPPLPTGEALVEILIRGQLCKDPTLLTVHKCQELVTKEYGDAHRND